MQDPLACYGPRISALAGLTEDLDPMSQSSWESWYIARWQAFADGIGFREALDPAIESVQKSGGMLGALAKVPVNALVQWIDKHGAKGQSQADYPAEKIALLREQVIEEWRATPSSLWRVSVDAENLPGHGCIGKYRLFPQLHAATYFRKALSQDPTPQATCTGSMRQVVFMGTWPWYSGAALFDHAPGLRWRSIGEARPAEQGARVMTSAWTRLGNAKIDARDVAAQFDRLIEAMSPIFSTIQPVSAGPGTVYGTPGGLLRVDMGDTRGRYLNGPLGPVSINAYNHCIRCFSAFFALRRALMRGELNDNLRAALNKNADPCVHNKLAPKKPLSEGTKLKNA